MMGCEAVDGKQVRTGGPHEASASSAPWPAAGIQKRTGGSLEGCEAATDARQLRIGDPQAASMSIVQWPAAGIQERIGDPLDGVRSCI